MSTAKKPMKTLFEAMFHGKRAFSDFMLPVAEEDLGRAQLQHGTRQRELINPSERLRAYHNFLRLFLIDFLPVHEETVFSYRKGVSARGAVAKHSLSRNFYVTDIEAFFPSISREIVHRTIVNGMPGIPIADLSSYVEHVLDLLCVDGALPIGFSTSPGLSNAALFPFDVAFHRRCEQLNVIYTRYADDIVLSSDDQRSLKSAVDELTGLLQSHFDGCLRQHPTKSKYLRVGGKIKLLGMVLLPNGIISVDTPVKNEIETMLHLYLRDRQQFNMMKNKSAAKIEARLAGLLNYVNTVDQMYLEKLRRKYGAAVVDLFLHRSFG